jgi:hypothetical protein
MSIMQKARERDTFKRPDISAFVPKGQEDVVARIAAAGQKIMYSPEMRDELTAEVQRDAPVAQKMAESVTGLMLTLDSKMQGGIPEEALFPAALDMLGEAAEVLSQAGAQVTMEEYNDAARLLFIMMAKKLGLSDDQIMGAAEQAAGAAEGGGKEPPEPTEAPPPEQDEEAAMQEGFK